LHSPEDKILPTVPSKGVLAHLVGHSAFCPGQVRRCTIRLVGIV
jgi:hypothetical protein